MIIKNLKAIAIATSILTLTTAGIASATTASTRDNSSTVKNLVPDSAITASIKAEFLADTTINGLSIHVETINGVVTLTGNVPSEDMKNKAISIAQSRDGVKKVVSKLKIKAGSHPVKTAISDSAITASIKGEFLADPDINGLNIHVETKNGVVALMGNVPSRDMKEKAESIAQSRDGVKKVVSKLKIKAESHPVKAAVSDSAITASIKKDFLADSTINGLSIHVETNKGIVNLTGDVPNADMKARAESIAQSKDGVKQVVSKIRIKAESHPVKTAVSDSAITASIKRDFLADSAINGLSIHVETNKGIVTLTGDVPNADMKARAESIAQSKDGVRQVVSKIRIK